MCIFMEMIRYIVSCVYILWKLCSDKKKKKHIVTENNHGVLKVNLSNVDIESWRTTAASPSWEQATDDLLHISMQNTGKGVNVMC